jgi:hypothetical protein
MFQFCTRECVGVGPHRFVHMTVCVNILSLTNRMRWCVSTSLCSYDSLGKCFSFKQEKALVWSYFNVFTGQTTTTGLNRIWTFKGGLRVSDAIRDFPYSKVKILWDMTLYSILIIIIIQSKDYLSP